MEEYRYSSNLAVYMQQFMDEKYARGYESPYLSSELREIDKYLIEHPTGIEITENYYQQWFKTLDDGNRTRKTIYKKASSFCQLLRYMRNIGIECHVPRLPRENDHKFIPYIYSYDEVQRIFAAADSLRIRNNSSRSSLMPFPALMRLLYSTGMRVGEAVSLRNRDVDLSKHKILLETTKNKHQRICPINPSLNTVLRDYIEYRNRLPLEGVSDDASPFFVTSRGMAIDRDTVKYWFHYILKKAGIPYRGNFAGPRIHDLRHTACVHAMIKLANEGLDLYTSLPVLSRFLGHLDPYSTECYLRLTQELYPDVIHKANLELSDIETVLKTACKTEHWDEDD